MIENLEELDERVLYQIPCGPGLNRRKNFFQLVIFVLILIVQIIELLPLQFQLLSTKKIFTLVNIPHVQ